MHRRSQGSQALVPFDPEIEVAARRLSREARRKKRTEASMAEDNRVLRAYALPQASGITSSIVSPAVEASNFELSPALIYFVEREQFAGHPSENPNAHLRKFPCEVRHHQNQWGVQRRYQTAAFPFLTEG